MQLRSVAVELKGDEPRFLQWTKSVGLARVEEYRDYIAKCAVVGSVASSASSKISGHRCRIQRANQSSITSTEWSCYSKLHCGGV